MRGIVALLLVVGVTGVCGSAFAEEPVLEREFEAVDEVEIYFKTVKELTLTGEREVVSFDSLPEENKELGLTVLKDELPVKLFFDKPRRHDIAAQSEHPTVIKILEITDAWIKALKKSPEQECIKKLFVMMRRSKPVLITISFTKTGEEDDQKITAHVVIEGFFEGDGNPEYLSHLMRAVLQKDPVPMGLLSKVGLFVGLPSLAYLSLAYMQEWTPFASGSGGGKGGNRDLYDIAPFVAGLTGAFEDVMKKSRGSDAFERKVVKATFNGLEEDDAFSWIKTTFDVNTGGREMDTINGGFILQMNHPWLLQNHPFEQMLIEMNAETYAKSGFLSQFFEESDKDASKRTSKLSQQADFVVIVPASVWYKRDGSPRIHTEMAKYLNILGAQIIVIEDRPEVLKSSLEICRDAVAARIKRFTYFCARDDKGMKGQFMCPMVRIDYDEDGSTVLAADMHKDEGDDFSTGAFSSWIAEKILQKYDKIDHSCTAEIWADLLQRDLADVSVREWALPKHLGMDDRSASQRAEIKRQTQKQVVVISSSDLATLCWDLKRDTAFFMESLKNYIFVTFGEQSLAELVRSETFETFSLNDFNHLWIGDVSCASDADARRFDKVIERIVKWTGLPRKSGGSSGRRDDEPCFSDDDELDRRMPQKWKEEKDKQIISIEKGFGGNSGSVLLHYMVFEALYKELISADISGLSDCAVKGKITLCHEGSMASLSKITIPVVVAYGNQYGVEDKALAHEILRLYDKGLVVFVHRQKETTGPAVMGTYVAVYAKDTRVGDEVSKVCYSNLSTLRALGDVCQKIKKGLETDFDFS